MRHLSQTREKKERHFDNVPFHASSLDYFLFISVLPYDLNDTMAISLHKFCFLRAQSTNSAGRDFMRERGENHKNEIKRHPDTIWFGGDRKKDIHVFSFFFAAISFCFLWLKFAFKPCYIFLGWKYLILPAVRLSVSWRFSATWEWWI